MNDIQVSKEKMFEDLVKQLEDCKIVRFRYITEEHSKLLWNIGEIIVRHPLFSHGEKMDLYETLSKRLSFSTRYLEAGVQVYQTFPFNTADEALEEAHKRLPDRVTISQRALIGLAGDSSIFATAAKTTDSFKNAIEITLMELILNLEGAEYVKIYRGDSIQIYKLPSGTTGNNLYNTLLNQAKKMQEEKPTLVAHIKDDKLIIDSEIAEPNPELNPEPSDELVERIDNVENDKNVEIIEPNLDKFRTVDLESRLGLEEMKATKKSTLIAKVPPKNKIVPGYVSKAEIMAMEFWKRIGGEDTTPDPVWIKREKVHAKRLIKMDLTIEDVLNIYEWRIQNDDRNFWEKKLHSLAMIYSHLSDWSIEAKHIPPSFEDFLNKNPSLDYRKFPMSNKEEAYIKASKCKQALERAKRAGVVLTEKDFKTLYEASRLKFDVFNKGK